MPDVELGTYKFDRETKNTVRYQMVNETTGRPDTIYVQKSRLPEGDFPQQVQVLIRFP